VPKSPSIAPDFAEIAEAVLRTAHADQERESELVASTSDGDTSQLKVAKESSSPEDDGVSLPVRELPPPAEVEPLPAPDIDVDLSSLPEWRRWRLWRTSSSWGVSIAVHVALLLLLAWLVETTLSERETVSLTARFDKPTDVDSLVVAEQLNPTVFERRPDPGEAPELERRFRIPKIEAPNELPLEPRNKQGDALGLTSGEPADLLMRSDAPVDGALGGRGRDARAALLQDGGGNDQSENAVDRGLRWLMAQQCKNGSWNFNHHKGLAGAASANPGTEASVTAATALVLLPYLGAGHTHLEGEYREVVQRALYYLGTHAVVTQSGTDLQDGTMYGQGLATIALCEAYAMTEDPALRPLAQGAIDFIIRAQNVESGGWRYSPGEPGDMTVTGWQLMGLKSGQMAHLKVPSPAILNTQRFLDSLQSDKGSQYGYLNPTPRRSTTAIGLLMRMYTGWQRSNFGLQRGVEHLDEWGPSEDNIYYNYYATQVMHHWGGPLWERWNEKMRDSLIAGQAKTGNENGSWFFKGDPGAKEGGRLYCTAMAVMTLEVYYRYMPLYRSKSADGDF